MPAATLRARLSLRDAGALAAFAALFVAVLLWAKWDPYWHKLAHVASSGSLGHSILTGGKSAPPPVSLAAGWDFLTTYVVAVWPAILAGLAIGAACQTVLPRRLLLRVLGDDGHGATARAALAGLPMMLCTCCSAPVTVGMRRGGVPVRPALAYWLATPLLNPVVIAFTALVLPAGWVALRIGMAVLLLLALLALVPRGRIGAATPAITPPATERFPAAFARLALRLLPEYALLVFTIGALRGALFPLGHDLAALSVLGALLLAASGTLLAIPTAGEIAVVAALLAAGFPAWLAAALLITLPAVSAPSLAMVSKVFPRRVALAVPAAVLVAGLATSGAALALGL